MSSSSCIVDHLVVTVSDLPLARAHYESLGFFVSPEGVHPFGTHNACIFFSDNTFLEPLAILSRETCEQHITKQNPFVVHDNSFRFRHSDGISALATRSPDAASAHRFFVKRGWSAGKRVKFARKFVLPNDDTSDVSFNLSFARDARSPDALFFVCEPAGSSAIERSTLTTHSNGVTGIREVVLVESNPSDFQYFLGDFFGQREIRHHSFGIEFETSNTKVSVLTPEGFEAFFGIRPSFTGRGLRFFGLVLSTTSLDSLPESLIKTRHRRSGRVILEPVPNVMNFCLAFEE